MTDIAHNNTVDRPSALSRISTTTARTLRKLADEPLGMFGFAILAILVLVAIFAPLIAPYDPARQALENALQPPSWTHLAGTDEFGRDIFSRLVYGTRITIQTVLSVSVIVDGQLWGLIACHHYSPRRLSLAVRVAAEMFGQYFSLHLVALKRKHKLEAAARARQLLDRFLRSATSIGAIDELLGEDLADFAALVPCHGIGVWLHESWRGGGTTPAGAGEAKPVEPAPPPAPTPPPPDPAEQKRKREELKATLGRTLRHLYAA